MKELVVISGKGGTGKTSITASFAVLAERAVIADCDVDAADLHLVLSPEIHQRSVFVSGHEARIRTDECAGCGVCEQLCRFDAVRKLVQRDETVVYAIDPIACEGCGVCVRHCPRYAIDFPERECGEWFVSQTRCGPMVHASLFAAAENSGKLVSLVREKARAVAKDDGRGLVLIDGSPGIGCPVIASITGVSLALVVTEPTVSGLHDLERIAQVTAHFRVPTCVCINKWDLNSEMTERITTLSRARGLAMVGRVRYDPAVTRAQLKALSLVEYADGGAASDVRRLWKTVVDHLNGTAQPETADHTCGPQSTRATRSAP
jgi:MinD superfamily P-loop ATPase